MDQPENLQIIKDEPTTPPPHKCNISPALLSSPNIKKRLNLHLKQRLQQDTNHSPELQSPPIADTQHQKETPKLKQRRPYQKRADKPSTGGTPTGQRKYKKHKLKAAKGPNVRGGTAAALGNVSDGALSESTMSFAGADRCSAAEDSELDSKTGGGRDKKCPDVLGLVLNMKKRALMQNPEVQDFMRQLMEAFKS